MEEISVNRYFVDEAGDMNLFDKKGTIIVGNEGVSNYFMVGVATFGDYNLLESNLKSLQNEISNDAYFRNVPSINSTTRQFHACKDLPEIRREVFKVLARHDAKIFIAIKRKRELAAFARELYAMRKEKIKENNIYDELIMRLFRNLLHKADSNIVCFARRGKSARTDALNFAIEKAKTNFTKKYGYASDKPVSVNSMYPFESFGLQAIDYYLWAVQRMYEKKEDRFFSYISDKYKLIMDIDDKRNKPSGEWYNSENILTCKKLSPWKARQFD